MVHKLDWEKYLRTAVKANAEGMVLLSNKNKTLPLQAGSKVAVFGRMQNHYYKSGTGSGGMVNVTRVTGILDGLLECKDISVNKDLIDAYADWEKEHPFDRGIGWGNEPWSQEEMPLSDELVHKAAKESDIAIVIIARTAGEDRDSSNEPGSYLLTEIEEDMLSKVRSAFGRLIVLLNVGNIIDMSFVDRYNPDAVLYVWQGGMTGGTAVAEVLTGKAYPSGKLTDTIAYSIKDYPSHGNFGDLERNLYAEDIYVGYRYFETVAKDKVRYPFGFGLSYTDFEIKVTDFNKDDEYISLEVVVKNIGDFRGKEVVQIYYEAPQGLLGKPARSLAAFAKTKELQPDESQAIKLMIKLSDMASYDDSGITGYKSCYLLEAGEYKIYVGGNVRDARLAGSFELTESIVTERLSEAMAPVIPFKRMKPVLAAEGNYSIDYEDVPTATIDTNERRRAQLPEEIAYTADKGIKLIDVKEGKASMKDFIAQLSDFDLACIVRGEGMGSPKVTAGTASAFGGVTDSLKAFGIPIGCCADGPSGIRMDSGAKAFSLPCGTLLACTFNEELVEDLYSYTGLELVKNKIDSLLGPGMNIHRHPLNGRNFEYFSEDPLVTGRIGAAMLRGLNSAGVTGTMKHFCANNQETKRHEADSVVSERALREIYLKGFEIAVRSGEAKSVMTTYGPVNGIWTAGHYDLNTQILRNEWGYKGIVMTDWWACINERGKPADRINLAAMARAQNDLYMVVPDASSYEDNILKSLDEGTLSRAELQRNAMNICSFLMDTHAMERLNGINVVVEIVNAPREEEERLNEEIPCYTMDDSLEIPVENIGTVKDSDYVFVLTANKEGFCCVDICASSDLSELAQIPVTVYVGSVPHAVITWNGSSGQWLSKSARFYLCKGGNTVKLHFGQSGLCLRSIRFQMD